MKKNKTGFFLLIAGGFLAGIANGLLGAGGGIVIVLILTYLLGDVASSRDIFANALCIMLPLSVISTVSYAFRGGIDFESFGIYILPAIAGGVLGGYLLGRIKTSLLRALFSGIMVYSGISLMVR